MPQLTTNQVSALKAKGFDDAAISAEAKKRGYALPSESIPGALGAVARFTGVEKLGQGLGQALFMLTPEYKGLKQALDEGKLSPEEFTSIATGGITGKEVIGSALNTAATIASAGTLGPGSSFVRTTAPGVIKTAASAGKTLLGKLGLGVKEGAIQGAKQGAIFGGASGASDELAGGGNGYDVLKKGLEGAALGGLGGGLVGGAVGGIGGGLQARAARKQELVDLLKKEAEPVVAETTAAVQKGTKKAGLPGFTPTEPIPSKNIEQPFFSKEAAAYNLDKVTGKAVKDPVFKTAFKDSGVPIEDLALVKASSPSDHSAMRDMINLARGSLTNVHNIQKPEERVGQTFISRVKILRDEENKVGKKIDEYARNNFKGVQIATETPVNNFLEALNHRGVEMMQTKEGGTTLDFSGSDFADLPGVERPLQTIFRRALALDGDAYKAHQLKRLIDATVEYGKRTEGGLTSESEAMVKELRHGLDTVLDKSSPIYKDDNMRYSIATNARQQADRLIGPDLAKQPLENMRAGEIMSRILGSASAKPLSVLMDVEKAARKLGGKFDDSIIAQVRFADLLQEITGSAPRSLGGIMERAASRVSTMRKIASDVANLKFGDASSEVISKIMQTTPEHRLAALEAYINTLSKK